MPAGRPTKYNPEYCERLIDVMGQGNSFRAFAADIRVTEDTVWRWYNEIPEFSEAYKTGLIVCNKFWENFFKAAAFGKIPNANITAAIWATKRILHWRDKIDVEGQVQLSVEVQHKLEGSTKAELIELAKEAIDFLESKKKPVVIDLPKQLTAVSDRTQ